MLSVAALLVPAGGIAYLGAVSYRDERGAVSAQRERQQHAAQAIAARITTAVDEALDAVERATAVPTPPRRLDAALAAHWFWLDADQQLRVPRGAPATLELAGALDRTGCAAGRPLEDCVRELQTRQTRISRLHAAQRAEATGAAGDARKLYTALAAFDDSGPAALLGLARLHPGNPEPVLAELERRFADRTVEVVPVRLAAAALRARTPAQILDLADAVLAGRHVADPIVRLGVVDGLRARVAGALPAALAERRANLDEQAVAIRREARAAAGLADDLGELARTATPAWRGRQAAREPQRTLIYRRRAEGGVVGLAVDAPLLEQVAGAASGIAAHARPLVLAAGASPGPGLRTIAQVPLGAALPHLSLALVNPLTDPDPLDAVIAERSRKHVIYTSALAVALGLGLLATIRGAARARELAQLKSDFVSTVSHELKTPLTSIRMFAEMLEQGVAQGDPGKLARYHGVIVQESQRLGLLIANLLDYAQIERGTRRYTHTRHPIAQLAHHAVATFEALRDPERGGRNPIAVEVSREGMAAEVDADRDVVVQALLNLLANAAKYGGADEPVEVSAGADEGSAWISVRDHGPGIPPAEQARIFREFYRAPEAYRANVEGTGLGLALVKRHIEALGGTVSVASQVGEGARFTIRLPRASASSAEAAA